MAKRAHSLVDDLMERASAALASMSYFKAEALAMDALGEARRRRDYAAMARIVLPLQEARRQIRQQACDTPGVRVVDEHAALKGRVEPGCWLVRPSLLGMDAARLRARGRTARVPLMVLAREPLVRSGPNAGAWPVVAVGERRPDSLIRAGPNRLLTLRAYVPPPEGTEPDPGPPTRDRSTRPIEQAWFVAAQEALGDAAIRSLRDDEPAAVRVDEVLDMLEALPDHEKLHQRLEHLCHEAILAPIIDRPWIREAAGRGR